MNLWLSQSDDVWRLAGWTMIHFLWVGCLIAAAGGLTRLALRWAWPNVRYALSLVTLLALAVAPVVIAGWLAANGSDVANLQPRALPRGRSPLVPTLPQRNATPGQSPALQATAQVVIDLAHADPQQPSLPATSGKGGVSATRNVKELPNRSTNPLPDSSPHGGEMLDAAAVHLPWLWIAGAPLTFSLLAAGLIGSGRLRRRCTPLTSGPVFEACQRLRTAMRLTRRVSVAACEQIAQPMLIGIARPLVLLPASALSGWTAEELEMVLVHELAHVRRWDNLVNLLQRVIESLLFFHPAVWLVSRQVRRDREECCDTAVVARTQRPREYAELLVSMAAALPRRPAARLAGGPFSVGSTMASHPLAGRIRRILKLQEESMGITRRTLAAMVALPLITVAAMVYTAAAQEEQNPPSSRAEKGPERPGSDKSVEEPSGGAREGSEKSTTNVPNNWWPAPEKLKFTFTATTRREAIGKLADQLRTFGNHVEISMNADGTISLMAWQSVPPTPAASANEYGEQKASSVRQRMAASSHDAAESSVESKLASGEVLTRASDANDPSNSDRATFETARKFELKILEAAILQVRRELADLEVQKELAQQNAPRASVQNAVSEAMNNDAKLAAYKQQVFQLRSQLQQGASGQGNLSEGDIARLRKQLENVTQEAEFYRISAEKRLREQLRTMQTEQLHAVNNVYDIRVSALKKQLQEWEQQLAELEKRTSAGSYGGNENQARRDHDATATTTALFPSLADQKIADRAYKLLGLELEPVSDDEHARVKKLGYAGGLRIVDDPSNKLSSFDGDILVGLHVWPITDMKSLDAVLVRDDLDQLNPLKYYIVRNRERTGQFGNVEEVPDHVVTGRLNISDDALMPRELSAAAEQFDQLAKVVAEPRIKPFDVVRVVVAGAFPDQPIDGDYAVEPQGTLALGPRYGRVEVAGMTLAEAEKAIEKHLEEIFTDVDVQVTLPVNSTRRQELTNAVGDVRDNLSQIDPVTGEIDVELPLTEAPPAQLIYHYDGKTFEQWRESWRQELKTERRLEAIEALAAFGRADYAKEAVAAILDVAAEYDPRRHQSGKEQELVERIVERLARLPADQVLPQTLQRLASTKSYEHQRWQAYAAAFVQNLPVEPPARELAAALLEYADREMLSVIASYLVRTDQALEEPLTIDVARQALLSDPPIADPAYLLRFTRLDKLPEQLRVVLHPEVGRAGRDYLQHFTEESPQIAAGVTDGLLAVMADPQRIDQHVAAIRSLRKMTHALSRPELQAEGARAVEALKSLLQSSDVDSSTTVAAAVALMALKGFPLDDGLVHLRQSGVISEENFDRLSMIEERLLKMEAQTP